jgi:hypothetical protein
MIPEQFWSKVRKGAGCWEWQGPRDAGGYGTLWVAKVGSRRAHRLSWMLTHGDIPHGLQVRHECDNPPCVNPAHLRLGTHADNMDDMRRRGRGRSGKHNRASGAAVAESVNRLGSISAAAVELGISRQAIHGMFKDGRVRWTYQIVVNGTAVAA